jgi:hypothetical protein
LGFRVDGFAVQGFWVRALNRGVQTPPHRPRVWVGVRVQGAVTGRFGDQELGVMGSRDWLRGFWVSGAGCRVQASGVGCWV